MDESQQTQHRLTSFLYQYDLYISRIKHILLSLVAFAILSFLFLLGIALGYFFSIVSESQTVDDTKLIEQATNLPEMETVSSTNIDLLALYNAPEPTLIAGPSEVSPYVTSALMAAEDAQFYEHNGILPKALLRAMYQDIFDRQFATGGSTITQQLIKNQILTNERTYQRKAKEVMYAMRIEKLLTKDEILFTYLNRVPFGLDTNGQHITGITSASYGIFGKAPHALNLAESAYLTGLLQSPYFYTPFHKEGQLKSAQDIEPSIHRQRYVLKRMRVEQMISETEYREALAYDVKNHFSP
ncbi:transglycosylase [Staphylococcus sp. 17KM0847]|nr:biosynthetic peptidoglycan transglycosylase [Staphylococcus sp. 17KM0847]QLK86270.1 transglycosylase [Staphylococcus sp. 17KM0847]